MKRLLELERKLFSIIKAIEAAEAGAGRRSGSVDLLAVSKTKPASDIEALYRLGCRQFGENYVQEAVDKVETLCDLSIEWHYIGKIQSNKTSIIASTFDWVHTVASKKIADRLSNAREGSPLNILIQVNIDDSKSKSGVALNDLDDLADYLTTLPNLGLRGLMSIPDPSNEADLKYAHQSLKEAFNCIQTRHPHLSDFDTLSMGMTNDLNLAIAEGSTMVRIGTALFGARAPKDKI